MISRLVLCVLLVLPLAASANLVMAPTGGVGGALSCTAVITGSATGNAILTGTATALANLACH